MAPWREPPPDIARRVADVLGDTVWKQLGERWSRVLAVDPALRQTEWYRTPEEVRREFAKNPRAAWFTQHGLGLAIDVTPRPAKRAAFIAAARREGFHVQTYTSSRHVHLQVLSARRWAVSPLRNVLERLLGPRPRRR